MLTRLDVAGPISLLGPPYERFSAEESIDGSPLCRGGGWSMVWNMGVPGWEAMLNRASDRPGGLALVVVLPESARVQSVTQVLKAIERTRPQVVLPFHESLDPGEVSLVLRRPPPSLSASVGEYLAWRGISTDVTTARIIRRTVELSEQVQTITALARSLYMSRRALGRRFMTRSLPVPSHWLHVARLIRATIRLQNTEYSLFQVAYELGYPDGFSLSNQMSRLCGVRPSEARERLGWEWLLEAWLMREWDTGGLACRTLSKRGSLLATPTTLIRASGVGASPATAVQV